MIFRFRIHLIGLSLAMVSSLGIAQEKTNSEAGQTTIRGFVLPKYDADMNLIHKLEGDEAEILPNGEAVIHNLRLQFYRNGRVETRVYSPTCTYNRKTNQGRAATAIRIARDDLVVTGDDYSIDGENERVVINKNAKVVIRQTDVRIWGDEE